jgi:hypothetical protein
MAKKALMVLVLACALTGGAFAKDHKHQSFDMMLGLNFGEGLTPNFFRLFQAGTSDAIPAGNYAVTLDLGMTFDFYLLYWLSFTTGALLHPDIYLLLDQNIENIENFTDIAATPVCLTIPIAAHINIPKAEWLYAGVGVNFNIPLYSFLDSVITDENGAPVDTKGKSFIGLPIDIGFDFIRAGRGGMRLFFRLNPEFHERGITFPIGLNWQIWNWRLTGARR